MAVRQIIFDLDGTLIDSRPGIVASLRAAFRAVCPGRALDPLDGLIGPPLPVMVARLAPELAEETRAAIVAAFRRHYDAEGLYASALYPDVAATLAALHAAGVHCYVATNKPATPTARLLDHFGLAGHFQAVLSPDSAQPAFASKTEMVAHLLMSRVLAPGETWLVGDSPDDREAARANGLGFVAARYGYGRLEAPDGLSRFAELSSRLASIPLSGGSLA